MAHTHAHHGHDHGHHHPAPADMGRTFAIGVALNVSFVAIEGTAGALTGSLALVADAGHNLSDVLGLLLAWGASVLVKQPPSGRRTYGWRKSSVLAALANAVLLLIAVGVIAAEAVRRFGDPAPVEGGVVAAVAAVGIVVNGATALLFMRSQAHDLNARGAYLHMLSDAAVSAGVVVAGGLVAWTGRDWIDPAVSLAIAGIIAVGTWGLLKESAALAMDAAPRAAAVDEIRAYLSGLPGVARVHDLHVWAISTTETALTAHLVRPEGGDDALLSKIAHTLHDRFGIEHSTLQIERDQAAACGGSC